MASENVEWRQSTAEFGTEVHYRSKYAVAVPNAALRGASSVAELGAWMAIGEAWAQVALRFLPSDDSLVADIGCGCGKMARFLMGNPDLRFVGFDIFQPAIDWCRREFPPVFGDRARFVHLDVRSTLYNSTGVTPAEEVHLPLENGSVDLVICASLFTHLLEPEMRHYLSEVARVLRVGGRLLASIHDVPAAGYEFSGDVTRIDMSHARFLRECVHAGLDLFENLGDLYGQQAFVLERH